MKKNREVPGMTSRTKSQAGKYSKTKGSRFERDVCKILNETFDGLVVFERTPASGGTVYRGDVLPKTTHSNPRERIPLVDFPFIFELKNQEGWTFKSILESFATSQVASWWGQTEQEAEEWDKIPLLVFTKNYHSNYIMFDRRSLEFLSGSGSVYLNHLFVKYITDDVVEYLYVALFTEFLGLLDSGGVIKTCKLMKNVTESSKKT